MAEKTSLDRFCQVARASLLFETAVTTVQTQALDFGLSSRDMLAAIIHKIEIIFDLYQAIADNTCMLGFGFFGRNVDGLAPSDSLFSVPSCYAHTQRQRAFTTSGTLVEDPLVLNFTELPEGGLIVPARPLYIGSYHVGLSANQYAGVNVYYSLRTLDQTNMLDLIQTMVGIGLTP